MRKLFRLESNGLPSGTRVLYNGQPLLGFLGAQWAMGANGGELVIRIGASFVELGALTAPQARANHEGESDEGSQSGVGT